MSSDATFRVRWQARALGVFVLALVAVGIVAIAGENASPWSWGVLVLVGTAAFTTSLANFGDVVETDEAGLARRNVLLGRIGLSRAQRASWAEVLNAIDQDGATFFLEVQDQRRWVLDQLDDHAGFSAILRQNGISVNVRTKPSLAFWRRDQTGGR